MIKMRLAEQVSLWDGVWLLVAQYAQLLYFINYTIDAIAPISF